MATGSSQDGAYGITNPQFTVAPVEVAIGATSTESTQLPTGFYIVSTDVDCYIFQGATGNTATTNHHRIPANYSRRMFVSGVADDYVVVIQQSASGTLQITKQ